jgi:hypothetical protein
MRETSLSRIVVKCKNAVKSRVCGIFAKMNNTRKGSNHNILWSRVVMMSPEEVKKLMEVERECVHRNEAKICDRDCAICDLVQPTERVLEAYDYVISMLEVLKDWRDEDDRK